MDRQLCCSGRVLVLFAWLMCDGIESTECRPHCELGDALPGLFRNKYAINPYGSCRPSAMRDRHTLQSPGVVWGRIAIRDADNCDADQPTADCFCL